MKDLYSDIKIKTVANDDAVDIAGYESLTFAINVTTAGDIKIQESDNNITFTNVDDKDYLGGKIVTTDGTGDFKFGYRGNKRYVKLVLGGTATAVAILGHPREMPVK